ncbi:homoserine dehydrogenase [Luteimonas lutimaris]|uniref:Homoserine dehydrogenase n=1 Tax=Luteimonas lutimaris TaxID=698645 RepID=A0ABP7N028_9GAMM
MSNVVSLPLPAAVAHAAPPRVALLGTGNVGGAFVARCGELRAAGVPLPAFAWLSNSRALEACTGDAPERVLERLRAAPARADAWSPWVEAEALRRGDILVDASASDLVAGWHGEWLARGIHVVTANKLGAGAHGDRAHAIAHARAEGGTHYGDAATVGAGLPLLRSIRELRAGGDRVHAIAGVLSGSLAWLFDRYDGSAPFSDCVRAARDAGYTEPDPREDLSGEDVRRKLLILARAAGIALEAHDVAVESLLTPALAASAPGEVDAVLSTLDAPLRARHAQATAAGATLRFIARLQRGDDGRVRASVGPEALDPSDPLAAGAGTDNRVAIWSDRYRGQPLVVQGPGAGAEVTAAALLDDVLRIVRGAPAPTPVLPTAPR